MRHQIENDVDAQRIRDSLGVPAEIDFVFSFAFPAVADVTVVDGEDYHPLPVVEQSANVHFLGAFAAKNGLQR